MAVFLFLSLFFPIFFGKRRGEFYFSLFSPLSLFFTRFFERGEGRKGRGERVLAAFLPFFLLLIG